MNMASAMVKKVVLGPHEFGVGLGGTTEKLNHARGIRRLGITLLAGSAAAEAVTQIMPPSRAAVTGSYTAGVATTQGIHSTTTSEGAVKEHTREMARIIDARYKTELPREKAMLIKRHGLNAVEFDGKRIIFTQWKHGDKTERVWRFPRMQVRINPDKWDV